MHVVEHGHGESHDNAFEAMLLIVNLFMDFLTFGFDSELVHIWHDLPYSKEHTVLLRGPK